MKQWRLLKKSHAAGDLVLQEKLHKETKIVPNGESQSQKNDPLELKLQNKSDEFWKGEQGWSGEKAWRNNSNRLSCKQQGIHGTSKTGHAQQSHSALRYF